MASDFFNHIDSCSTEDLFGYGKMEGLERMTDFLIEEGYHEEAKETYDLLRIIKQAYYRVEVIHNRMEKLWYYANKYEDNDIGKESFKEAVEEYRNQKK